MQIIQKIQSTDAWVKHWLHMYQVDGPQIFDDTEFEQYLNHFANLVTYFDLDYRNGEFDKPLDNQLLINFITYFTLANQITNHTIKDMRHLLLKQYGFYQKYPKITLDKLLQQVPLP